jgi:hypothetical protein
MLRYSDWSVLNDVCIDVDQELKTGIRNIFFVSPLGSNIGLLAVYVDQELKTGI